MKQTAFSFIEPRLSKQGIDFHVGHVWEGVSAHFERVVKDLHRAHAVCEICQEVPFFERLPKF